MKAAPEAAEAVAEAVRELNHATLPGQEGWEWPSDVYAVVGSLGTAVARMVQALEQAGAWLDRAHTAGLVVEDRDGVDVAASVADVLGGLESAVREVRHLAVSLDWTQQSAAHLAGVPHTGRGSRS